MSDRCHSSNVFDIDFFFNFYFQVYLDAKRLTLSAHSWPARFVACEASKSYDYERSEATIPANVNLQYVNPPSQLTLLTTIFDAERPNVINKVLNCQAISLRIDGSIDRNQIDKIYVMAKIVDPNGALELIFLGVGEQKKRGADGLLEAALTAISTNFGGENLKIILKKVSSICTDGASINTDEKGGLWTLLEKECAEAGSSIPLIKLWCAAHRADLVWKDLTPNSSKASAELSPEIKSVDEILTTLSSLSSHFHNSAVRTNELIEIGQF